MLANATAPALIATSLLFGHARRCIAAASALLAPSFQSATHTEPTAFGLFATSPMLADGFTLAFLAPSLLPATLINASASALLANETLLSPMLADAAASAFPAFALVAATFADATAPAFFQMVFYRPFSQIPLPLHSLL
eukprot:6203742-Pleurochrysis_carterae.AAC.4